MAAVFQAETAISCRLRTRSCLYVNAGTTYAPIFHFPRDEVVLMTLNFKRHTADWDHALSTAGLICAGVGTMVLFHFLSALRSRKRALKSVRASRYRIRRW